MCPHTPEDYSREQAERRMTEKEEEALERHEDAERWMRGHRKP
jgi:hypothetical protein